MWSYTMGRGRRFSRCHVSRSWSASTPRRTRATSLMSRSSSQCRSREGLGFDRLRKDMKTLCYQESKMKLFSQNTILYSLQVCEEIFEKKCQITFNQEARNETVKMCHRPMEIRCDGRVNNRVYDDEDTCR